MHAPLLTKLISCASSNALREHPGSFTYLPHTATSLFADLGILEGAWTSHDTKITLSPFLLNNAGRAIFGELFLNISQHKDLLKKCGRIAIEQKAYMMLYAGELLGVLANEVHTERSFFLNCGNVFMEQYPFTVWNRSELKTLLSKLGNDLFPESTLSGTMSILEFIDTAPVPKKTWSDSIPTLKVLAVKNSEFCAPQNPYSIDYRRELLRYQDHIVRGRSVHEKGVGSGINAFICLFGGARSYLGTDISGLYTALARATIHYAAEQGQICSGDKEKVHIEQEHGDFLDRSADVYLFNAPGIYDADMYGTLLDRGGPSPFLKSYYIEKNSFMDLFTELRTELLHHPEKMALWRILAPLESNAIGVSFNDYGRRLLKTNGLRPFDRPLEKDSGIHLFERTAGQTTF